MKNEYDTRAFVQLHVGIEDYILNHRTFEAWKLWTKKPFCFLKFDPEAREITVCRWERERLCAGEDERLWHKVRLFYRGEMNTDVFKAVDKWTTFWDDIRFNVNSSEPVPSEHLPNTRFTIQPTLFKFPEQTRSMGR